MDSYQQYMYISLSFNKLGLQYTIPRFYVGAVKENYTLYWQQMLICLNTYTQRLHNERNFFFCLRGVNTLEFLYFLWLLFSKHHCHNPGFICLTWKHRVAFIGKSHSLSDIVVCPRLKWTLGQGLNNARACSPLHKKHLKQHTLKIV